MQPTRVKHLHRMGRNPSDKQEIKNWLQNWVMKEERKHRRCDYEPHRRSKDTGCSRRMTVCLLTSFSFTGEHVLFSATLFKTYRENAHAIGCAYWIQTALGIGPASFTLRCVFGAWGQCWDRTQGLTHVGHMIVHLTHALLYSACLSLSWHSSRQAN